MFGLALETNLAQFLAHSSTRPLSLATSLTCQAFPNVVCNGFRDHLHNNCESILCLLVKLFPNKPSFPLTRQSTFTYRVAKHPGTKSKQLNWPPVVMHIVSSVLS